MDFFSQLNKSNMVKKLEAEVRERADAKALTALASEVGHIAADVIRVNLEEASLTEHNSLNDIRAIVAPVLRDNYRYITKLTSIALNKWYESQGLGLRAVVPKYNNSMEDEIVEKISEKRFLDESN